MTVIFLVALATATLSCLGLIFIRLPKSFLDTDTSGAQKFHQDSAIPRIGGLAILVGLVTVLYGQPIFLGLIFLAFLAGFIEDLAKDVPPVYRLSFSFIAALLACLLLDSGFYNSGFSWIDKHLLANMWVAYPVAIFMIGGVMHGINIIDGYNGLSLGVSLLALTCLCIIEMNVGDYQLAKISIGLMGAILGVMLFNYPWGKIFIGDGGAYMIGFIIAVISLLLVNRNPQVSPWFPLMVIAYPVWETLFSIFRKKFVMKSSPTEPDGYHLHMLVYKKIIKRLFPSWKARFQNSAVSPILWIFSLGGMIPALLLWNNTDLLVISGAVFIALYCSCYWLIYKCI